MVKNGDFSVTLVEAESKIQFREHTAADGSSYAVVEPDAEYFIRVTSTTGKKVICKLIVDGECLGHRTQLQQNAATRDTGLWSRVGGMSVEKAFKFHRANYYQPGSRVEDTANFWTGEVTANFYSAVRDGRTESQRDYISPWKGENVGYVNGVTDPSKKKGVKSCEGSCMEIKECKTGRIYRRGSLLKTLRLKYCSAVGLIHAGLLPKTPGWHFPLMTKPPACSFPHVTKSRNRGSSEMVRVPKKI